MEKLINAPLNLKSEKRQSLLVIIKGIPQGKGIIQNYYRYKKMIKEKFQASIIKPYTLLFPKKLSLEERNYIDELLTGIAEYRWFTVINNGTV